MVWHLNALTALHWRHWDDEWVVFDAGSGQTHQMDTLTAVTLMVIEATPMPLADLVSQIAQELQLPNERELDLVLSGIVQRLASAGLIESAAP